VILERFEHPRWLSNTWLLAEGDGGAAVVVDSGGPVEGLLDTLRARRLRVERVLNTHHHFDHVAENGRLKSETGARVAAHRLDAPLVPGLDDALEDGATIRAGRITVRLLHIPGHTAGQAAYLAWEATEDDPGARGGDGAVCFTGDTLFRGSIGSVTAPGHTTFSDLRRSLVDRLLVLPDATRVAPGHSVMTTIGAERATNPFLRVLLGAEPEGEEAARYLGETVRLVVWGRDYDGGFKAWVRLPDGTDLTVPGSRVVRAGR
jgi:hydroxyacylglutathione hydrolase